MLRRLPEAGPDSEPRFRMLTLLREYAGERLVAQGELEAMRLPASPAISWRSPRRGIARCAARIKQRGWAAGGRTRQPARGAGVGRGTAGA